MGQRRAPLRAAGHKLEIQKSTERKRSERSHTGTCACGWEESASTYAIVRQEYRIHLRTVLGKDIRG